MQQSTEETTDWRRLREFKDVELTESFVLSWHLDGDSLQLDIDLCLRPEHPLYEPPRPAERACFRAALLVFPACTSVRRLDDGDQPAATAVVIGSLGHGKIAALRRVAEGGYEMRGRFGDIGIRAERPLLRIKSSTA